jgi:hypothetical protein
MNSIRISFNLNTSRGDDIWNLRFHIIPMDSKIVVVDIKLDSNDYHNTHGDTLWIHLRSSNMKT